MDKVFAICQICNEEDIIQYTVSHLLEQGIDTVIVNENLSDDTTWDKLQELRQKYGDRLIAQKDLSEPFYQSEKLTNLAQQAVSMGARWVIPVDGDELFVCTDPYKTLAQEIMDCVWPVIAVNLLNHFETGRDEQDINPYKRMVWRHPDANPLDKMICRYEPGMVIDRGNHRIIGKYGCIAPMRKNIHVRHLSARSADHFVRKHVGNALRLEAAVNEPADVGAHCRQYKECYVKHGAEILKEHYYRNFHWTDPTNFLIYDPPPYKGVF